MTTIVDTFAAQRAMARSRRSRRWLLPAAGASALVAFLALALPIVERGQLDDTVNDRTRRVLNGAAWRWQGLVGAGMSPGEATEKVGEALHARIVSSGISGIEIPFAGETDFDALDDSFRLNPFIRSTQPRTNDPAEQREFSESATRVAVLASAIQRHEYHIADAAARKHLVWGLLVAFVAGGASVLLVLQWRKRR